MTSDKEYLNILNYGRPTGTIELRPSPGEVPDVDPKIIANMRAVLSGEDLNEVYDISDRVIDELSLAREKKKLLRVFGGSHEISEAFSSVKSINAIQQEILFEEVDRNLLYDYSFIKAGEENVDEVDFLKTFLFGEELKSKNQRVIGISLFQPVLNDYKSKHFEVLKITKEALEMDSGLLRLFKERKLLGLFDELLTEFYGTKA